jgi:hypothetical protein
MSVQGRNNHNGAYLDWAWWIGLIGLIVTIIFVVILIGFTVDVALSNTANKFDQLFVSLPMLFACILNVFVVHILAMERNNSLGIFFRR